MSIKTLPTSFKNGKMVNTEIVSTMGGRSSSTRCKAMAPMLHWIWFNVENFPTAQHTCFPPLAPPTQAEAHVGQCLFVGRPGEMSKFLTVCKQAPHYINCTVGTQPIHRAFQPQKAAIAFLCSLGWNIGRPTH